MKKLLFTFLIMTLSQSLWADLIKFQAPKLSGKLISENIELTDWQAVLNCRFQLNGKNQESSKYPLTQLKKLDDGQYELNVKAANLIEALPNLEIQNCHYKLILIGKLYSTRQTLFGEIILFGQDQGKMSDKDLEVINNKTLLAKILQEKIKEIKISVGADGGIVLDE